MTTTVTTCRPAVLPGGDVVRVLGARPMDDRDVAALAEVIQAAKRMFAGKQAELAIERAAAASTVEALGVDAIWIAPTQVGAEIRASLCLSKRMPAADVAAALGRWSR